MYDGFGQLASDAQAVSGSVVSGTTPTVGYSYDAANDDRQTGITYPDGRAISYNYSSGIDSIMSQISSVRDSSGNLQAYTYLGLDTPVTFTDGNGVALSYLGTLGSNSGEAGDQYTGLDRFGRVIEQNWTGPYLSGPAVYPGVDQFEYGYDQDGNVLYKNAVTDTTSSTTNTTLASESQLFTYDNLNRLSNFSSGTLTFNGSTASISGTATETEGWTLDALGNWESSSVTTGGTTTTTSRTNSAQNQVKTVGSATLAYDTNGNTTTDQAGQTYTYDAWNRLTSVSAANGTLLAKYSYDAEGRRATSTESGTTTDLYYSDRWQVVQENVGTLVTAQHVWSPFYVDDMIETDTNPDVTTSQSNGSVDSGFGSNTSNHTTTTSLSSTPTSAVSAAVGSDILVAALVGSTPELLWYNSSGGLDTAYGSGTGIVSLGFTGWTAITGIVLQPSGKIDLSVTTSSGHLNVAQLTSTGAADTGFGSSGLETLTSLPAANDIVLAANGDLLVGGFSSLSFVITELNPSTGAADTSYNTSGTATVAVASSGSGFAFLGMATAPDGDLLLAGTYNTTSGSTVTHYVDLVAIAPAGVADSYFGTSGIDNVLTTTASLSSYSHRGPLAVNADGQIFLGLAVGVPGLRGAPPTETLTISEYNANGSADTSFGTSGSASLTENVTLTGPVLNILPNGQILIGAAGSEFTLARFNADGTLDNTFGTSGIKYGAAINNGYDMVVGADGEVVMVGGPASGSGIILQKFHTLSSAQRLYVEQDGDYNVTSLTDTNGNVVERYEYDPYGNVTVLNANGTVRGDGLLHSSFYAWNYTFQGGRDDTETGQIEFEYRDDNIGLGRWDEEDPRRYINGGNLYQLVASNTPTYIDPTGEDFVTALGDLIGSALSSAQAVGVQLQPTTQPTTQPAPVQISLPQPINLPNVPFNWNGPTIPPAFPLLPVPPGLENYPFDPYSWDFGGILGQPFPTATNLPPFPILPPTKLPLQLQFGPINIHFGTDPDNSITVEGTITLPLGHDTN